ncbi:TPA: hypothetical protein RFT07_002716 [Klebsiella aerogenes]|nr:hypothetical protein [Klebsiella aerogenes]
MGFPSPANDYAQRALTVDMICGTGPNTRIIETSTGYAVLDLSLSPKQSSTVMISYSGITDFAKVMGKSLVTRDGEAIEGDALDEVEVKGVVTFIINRAVQDDDDFPV